MSKQLIHRLNQPTTGKTEDLTLQGYTGFLNRTGFKKPAKDEVQPNMNYEVKEKTKVNASNNTKG
jgi:hypothetical protein